MTLPTKGQFKGSKAAGLALRSEPRTAGTSILTRAPDTQGSAGVSGGWSLGP